MKTGCVALVLCLNISVDPPDVIKIFPCVRMECWIGLLLPLISFILIFFIFVVYTLKNYAFLNSIKCLFFVISFLDVHATYFLLRKLFNLKKLLSFSFLFLFIHAFNFLI